MSHVATISVRGRQKQIAGIDEESLVFWINCKISDLRTRMIMLLIAYTALEVMFILPVLLLFHSPLIIVLTTVAALAVAVIFFSEFMLPVIREISAWEVSRNLKLEWTIVSDS
jgi:hypothetical protein